eukprot:Lankesteria_metandrocarpae@DN10695_c0_g1_i1.p1
MTAFMHRIGTGRPVVVNVVTSCGDSTAYTGGTTRSAHTSSAVASTHADSRSTNNHDDTGTVLLKTMGSDDSSKARGVTTVPSPTTCSSVYTTSTTTAAHSTTIPAAKQQLGIPHASTVSSSAVVASQCGIPNGDQNAIMQLLQGSPPAASTATKRCIDYYIDDNENDTVARGERTAAAAAGGGGMAVRTGSLMSPLSYSALSHHHTAAGSATRGIKTLQLRRGLQSSHGEGGGSTTDALCSTSTQCNGTVAPPTNNIGFEVQLSARSLNRQHQSLEHRRYQDCSLGGRSSAEGRSA